MSIFSNSLKNTTGIQKLSVYIKHKICYKLRNKKLTTLNDFKGVVYKNVDGDYFVESEAFVVGGFVKGDLY